MTLRTRWLRWDAEHWVHVLVMTQTALLVVWALVMFFMAWMAGVVLLALVPAALAGVSGWCVSAWRREQPWTWWVLVVLTGMQLNALCMAGLSGSVTWWGAVLLVFDAVLLLALLHPDSRARVASPAPSQQHRPVP